MVGIVGVEPTTSCSQRMCSTQTELYPVEHLFRFELKITWWKPVVLSADTIDAKWSPIVSPNDTDTPFYALVGGKFTTVQTLFFESTI